MKPRHWIVVLVLIVAAAWIGWWAGNRNVPAAADRATAPLRGTGPCPDGADPAYWKGPMDPTYVRDKPGKSPMGMDLVPVCRGAEDAAEAHSVRIESAIVQNTGVKIAIVERRDLARRIRAVGRVAYDERRVTHVHTKIQGWVERLFVEYEGESVRAGQPLLEIYSPDLVSTKEELLVAQRYRDSTRASPYEDVSRGGEDLYASTLRRLELWDVTDADIQHLLTTGVVEKTTTLHSPRRGVVTHLMVREGMEVDRNQNLYTIADLSTVWVYADVYEYELPWIDVGQKAEIELSYLPGQTLEGTVAYVYPYLDPKTRTARVRIELANEGGTLKPAMYATVTIHSKPRPSVVATPVEAVIRSGRRSLVIVSLGDGRFAPRDVVTGIDSGDGWVEIESGLDTGESVVVSGQFLLDSESKLREATQKLLSVSTVQQSDEGLDHGASQNDARHPPTTGKRRGPPGREGDEMSPQAHGNGH